MDVSDIGEFGLIKRLTAFLGPRKPDNLVLGIGDDAAVWREGDAYLVATTDTLVAGVHFLAGTPWADVGWKALATNVSDIAAMGAEPAFALVTLSVPPETPVEDLDGLYTGLRECATAYGVTIAGGDVVRANQFSVAVTLIGRARVAGSQPLLLRRGAALAGDLIAVSGTLGNAAAGLRRLRGGAGQDDALVGAQLRPHPRLALGREAALAGVSCGIDISDGLLQDVGHICEMSCLMALVKAQAVPISDALRSAYPDDALRLACTGGEDYELVLVGGRDLIERAAASSGVAVTFIGEMVDGPDRRARLLNDSGKEIEFGAEGWDHLRASERGA